MANSSSTPFLDAFDHPHLHEGSAGTISEESVVEGKQHLLDSIKCVEDMIVLQEDRLNRMQQLPKPSSHTLRVQKLIEDSLLVSRKTLEQMRQSLKCLESE